MKKKLGKAKDGRIVRSTIVDPENNTVKTRENKKTGKVVTKIKYADPASSGRKRERIVTKGPSETQIAIAKKYSDEIKDLGYKKGGSVKTRRKK